MTHSPRCWKSCKFLAAIFLLFPGLAATGPAGAAQDLPVHKIKLPPGFAISVYAQVPNARSMSPGPDGIVFVGTRKDKLYAVTPEKDFSRAKEVITLAKGLDSPNGVAFRRGSLYVAEISRIIRFDEIERNLKSPPQPVVVNDRYPDDKWHGWKFIAFGPDGYLYIPVGAPCNVCDPKKEIYSTITRIRPGEPGIEIFSKGVRNTVGFDWHPVTEELWFTDNGRDLMGDDIPPDELNRAPRKGLHFGFPYCHGGNIPDPKYGRGRNCSDYTQPEIKLGPHVAALGMRFYTGGMFPAGYRNQIFIAEHGSWNRSTPIGYRIILVRLENNKAVKYETFAEGWLQSGKAWGRPVDVLVMPDGSMLVSDDHAGAIYRISYNKK
ncbi:MAG: PQQ-dependent sugar dehydrogenase [Syntrophaceae bacterium]